MLQVEVDQVDDSRLECFSCGVVLTEVDDLPLPDAAWKGWDHAVVFSRDVYVRGSEVRSRRHLSSVVMCMSVVLR